MRKTVIEHLQELRKRLIIILVTLTVFFIAGLYYSTTLISWINQALLKEHGIRLIVTCPLDFLYAQIKIGFFIALFLTFPLILHQALTFLKPGLKKGENKILKRLLPLSMLLLITGILFCYLVLAKFGITFLSGLATKAGVENLWNINTFITFIFTSCLAICAAFQTPIIIFSLNKLGVVSLETLKKKRKYAIVLMFIIAAVVTPTLDAVTQILVAVPLLGMYELSLLMIRIWK